MTTKADNLLITVPTFKAMAKTKMPKRVGSVADLLYSTRQTRLALQKVVEELQKQETALKNHVIERLPVSDATGAAGKIARVQVIPKTTVQVEDWDKFYAYVRRNNAFELLQRRLSATNVRERLEHAGKRGLPGVKEEGYKDISLTKV